MIPVRRWKLFVLATLAAAAGRAQDPGPLPPFVPPANATPMLRVWGNPAFAALLENWARGFAAAHPEVSVEPHLVATGLAMPALYLGRGDIALFGRDTNPTDNDGFAHVLGYPHTVIELATGSLDAPGKSPALVVFVHRDNPLARLTLAQLDASFGPERRRGAPGLIRTWGELGLGGEWREAPIHLYADDIRSGPGGFFQRVVLLGSSKRNWENLTEFRGSRNLIGSTDEDGGQITAALRDDRFGLAVSTLRYANAATKPIALGVGEAGPFVLPTRETLIARTYPLARPVFVAVNRPPGQPLEPKVRAFLRHVLSPEGQEEIRREGAYLPLDPEAIAAQAKKLE